MKKAIALIVSVLFVFSITALSFAAGDVTKGKALFNDSELAGGTAGKSCNSCHPDGKGLENAGMKKQFNLGGKKQTGLKEAINTCIENALKGKALDKESQEMKDLAAYIKSFEKKTPAAKAKE
jgi:cytochrome c